MNKTLIIIIILVVMIGVGVWWKQTQAPPVAPTEAKIDSTSAIMRDIDSIDLGDVKNKELDDIDKDINQL